MHCSMSTRTLLQNSRLHLLITQLGISKEQKADMIRNVTKGRTASSAELHKLEADELIIWLSGLAKAKLQAKYNNQKIDSPADRMRRKILSICHELNWQDTNGKVDWVRLNNFLLKYGYLSKTLNKYTEAELPKLVTQFEQLLKHHYEKQDKNG